MSATDSQGRHWLKLTRKAYCKARKKKLIVKDGRVEGVTCTEPDGASGRRIGHELSRLHLVGGRFKHRVVFCHIKR